MRGEIVLVDFQYRDASGSKIRPALVVQDDAVRSINTFVAQMTSRIARRGPTRVLVDPGAPDGIGSGLKSLSLIVCENLFTVHQGHIPRVIGRLSPTPMISVDTPLKTAIGLP